MLVGGFIGLSFSFLLGQYWHIDNSLAFLGQSLIAIVLGVLIFKFLYQIAVFSLGVLSGIFSGPILLSMLDIPLIKGWGLHQAAWLLILLFAVCMGFICLFFERYLMIFITTGIGALVSCISGQLLLDANYNPTVRELLQVYDTIFSDRWWLLLAFIIIGILYQLISMKKTSA